MTQDESIASRPSVEELALAKRLAQNSKEGRDETLRAVKMWLKRKDEVEPLAMLKLWRGLYYCT